MSSISKYLKYWIHPIQYAFSPPRFVLTQSGRSFAISLYPIFSSSFCGFLSFLLTVSDATDVQGTADFVCHHFRSTWTALDLPILGHHDFAIRYVLMKTYSDALFLTFTDTHPMLTLQNLWSLNFHWKFRITNDRPMSLLIMQKFFYLRDISWTESNDELFSFRTGDPSHNFFFPGQLILMTRGTSSIRKTTSRRHLISRRKNTETSENGPRWKDSGTI